MATLLYNEPVSSPRMRGWFRLCGLLEQQQAVVPADAGVVPRA